MARGETKEIKTQEEIKEYLLSKRIINSNGCWIWTGGINKDGYGWVCFTSIRNSAFLIHRLIMNAKEGEQVLHKRECPNRNCFNPEHLYIGTSKDNVRDAMALGTHSNPPNPNENKILCKNGHPFDRINGRGQRICSICQRARFHKNNLVYNEHKRLKRAGIL